MLKNGYKRLLTDFSDKTNFCLFSKSKTMNKQKSKQVGCFKVVEAQYENTDAANAAVWVTIISRMRVNHEDYQKLLQLEH